MKYAPKPGGCETCPAFHRGVGFVEGKGPSNATLALVGSGPGEIDAAQAEPFSPGSPAGNRLSHWIGEVGLARNTVYIDNVVRCWLPARVRNGCPEGQRIPTKEELAHCWNEYGKQALLNLPDLRIVVPIGVPAMTAVVGSPGKPGWAGSVSTNPKGLTNVE